MRLGGLPRPDDFAEAPFLHPVDGDRRPGRETERNRGILALRPLAVTLLLLLLLELALRSPLLPVFPPSFRFPQTTTMGYDELVGYMRSRGGVRVAVLGDSVVQGLTVDSDGTLPYLADEAYADAGRQVDVFNLGITAGHADDFYPMVCDLVEEDAADVVVVAFDYRFYRNGGVTTPRYPELYAAVGSFGQHEDEPLVTNMVKAVADPARGVRARRALKDVWKLYGYRDYLDAVVFGGSPGAALRSKVNFYDHAYSSRPIWRKRTPASFTAAELQCYKVPPFVDDNKQITYLRMAMERAEAEGVELVVANMPLNVPALAELGALDLETHRRNIEYVERLCEENGATFLDLSDDCPEEYIADSVHPLAEGYEVLAPALVAGIEPLVRQAEEVRAR